MATHPGDDILTIIYPDIATVPPGDLLAWCEENGPGIGHAQVTRDEFTRRMAGSQILDQLHEAGRDTRVISLLDRAALAQWLATGDEGEERER